MSNNIKRVHSPQFKTNVVLALLKGEETCSQICSKYAIHPTQARRWREHALAVLAQSFNGRTVSQQLAEKDKLIEELYKQIGQLKVELDWVKKKLGIAAG